jgi:flagellar biosynthetic protein FlhB
MHDEPATSQERTESPTPRRRQKAREQGRVARSQELSAAVGLLAGALALATVGGPPLAGFAARVLHESARSLSAGPLTSVGAAAMVRTTALGLMLALLPFVLSVAAVTTLVNVLQARGVVSWQPVTPKLSHLSPAAGLRRLFGLDGVINLVKAMAKFAVLGVVAWLTIARSWPQLMSLADAPPAEVAAVLRALVLRLAVTCGFAFLAVALLDYGLQLLRHERSLRMSRQEVVREHRETEGDPLVKGRMQALARARARRRMMQAVRTADVVVVNPTEIAVALRYDVQLAPAPLVVAMGQRKLAQRIRAIAVRHEVPVVENRPVARALLATATVGRPIPPVLYAAVAEILAFVYRRRAGRRSLPAGLGRTA